MKRIIIVIWVLFFTSAAVCFLPQESAAIQEKEQKKPVKFLSATECENQHGSYRWAAKVIEKQPTTVKDVDIDDMLNWPELEVKTDSERSGKELEAFRIKGILAKMKGEDDGDLHIQCRSKKSKIEVVCEIPVGKPWDELRKRAFSLVAVEFPCEPHTFKLREKDVEVEIEGWGFFDGEHRHRTTPNRRSYDENALVWELHPVTKFTVLKKKD